MSARFAIPLPPGFRAREALVYHGRDPDGPAERQWGNHLTKAVWIKGRVAVLDLAIEPEAVRGTADADPATASALVRRLLGLNTDPGNFEQGVGTAGPLAPLITRQRGLRIVGTASVFEALCWAIMGQQITVALAIQLRRALIEAAGKRHSSGLRAFPAPEAVAALDPADLGRRRFSRAKAAALVGAARTIADGDLPIEALPALPSDKAHARLTALKGVGPWTAAYVLLRGCLRADAAPVADAGLDAALRHLLGRNDRLGPAAVDAVLAGYQPWRGLACCHLWASLATRASRA